MSACSGRHRPAGVLLGMLEINNVTKRFKNREVLRGISFTLQPGEVISLIGGNGSGKTTTFRLILGLLDPDGGSIRLNGRELTCKDAGYLPEQRCLYQDCTVYQQLKLTAGIGTVRSAEETIDHWLQEMGMTELKRETIGRLSKGNQQKIALINCLIKDAPIVIMDEPFTALDGGNIRIFLKIISRLREQGKTVLVSSHIYQPVNEICDRFLLLKEGKISTDMTVSQLRESERRMVTVSSSYEPQRDPEAEDQRLEGENTRYEFSDSLTASQFACHAILDDQDVVYRHCRIEDCR